MCTDFKRVNEVTKQDAYKLPLMTEILDALNLAHCISILELDKEYYYAVCIGRYRRYKAEGVFVPKRHNNRQQDIRGASVLVRKDYPTSGGGRSNIIFVIFVVQK